MGEILNFYTIYCMHTIYYITDVNFLFTMKASKQAFNFQTNKNMWREIIGGVAS